MEEIKFGKYVALAYEIFVVGDEEDASVYQFTKDKPDCFVFGLDQTMLQSFQDNIKGLHKGDKFNFTLTPDQAFGEREERMVMEIDHDIFGKGSDFDDERVFVGAMVPMMTANGMRIEGLVTKITPEKVTMDFNHQLAGCTVRYEGEVIELRDATQDELNPPASGCGSCGGNCGSCGSSCGDGGCGGGCSGCGGK